MYGSQYESLYQIKLDKNGSWWVGHNGHWLGYYPVDLFKNATPVEVGTPSNLLATQTCEVDWYGEVAAFTTTPWTKTPMGSGEPADAGLGRAANFKNPTYVVGLDAAAVSHFPDSDPNVMSADPSHYNPACYSRAALTPASASPDRLVYVGGPGGKAQGCVYK